MAGQVVCAIIGPWQCHESLAKAKALGHSSIIAAISALKRGSGDMLRDTAKA